MKKVLLFSVTLLASVYLYLAYIGIEPQDRRPGTLISGEVRALPGDLSFVADAQKVTLETQPWYGIPFSVTVVAVAHEGRIYVPSIYESPQRFPGSKYWNHVVAKNPQVRLRVGQDIYPLRIEPVHDTAEFAAAYAALGRKYAFWREQMPLDPELPRFALLRLERRTEPL